MPEGINNSLFLFFRCARRFTVLALGEIIVDTLCDTTFPLRLRDIQVRHMESVLFLHPLLDLFVCCALPKQGHVHVFEREFHSDILTRYGLRSASVGAKRTSSAPWKVVQPSRRATSVACCDNLLLSSVGCDDNFLDLEFLLGGL